MAPTILIVGATGNTGRSVVETLPGLLKNTKFASHRLLALTRSANSEAAKQLSKQSQVEVAEQNWIEITDDWLRERSVERVFIASHNEPTQFAEEGQFLINCHRAGVKYVVRISTTAANVKPDYPAYYPRTHWAIETMISQPEFKEMHWSSLQPNGFSTMFVGSTAQFIQDFKKTGKQGTLSMMINADTPTALVDPYDVGVTAAHLLAQEDTAKHNKARYVVNGPEDTTGEQVKKLVEQYIGEPVKDVKYKDMSFIEPWAESAPSPNLIRSVYHAPVTSWEGKAKAETTSPEIMELYPAKRTVADVLKSMVGN